MKKSIGTILLSAAFAATAGAAFAQGMHQHDQRAFSRPTERVEARLAYVKTALKITPAQEGQWNAYAASVRKDAAEREQKMGEWREKMAQAHGAGGERPQVSAIDRLDRQQKFLAAASEHLNARIAAVKPLYESLSAEQKKVADVVLVPHAGHRFAQGRGGHGRMHGAA